MSPDTPKSKKVLYVITKGTWGGAQRYVFDLARSLNTAEYLPVVACGTAGQLSIELDKLHIRTRTLTSMVRDILPTTDIIGFFEMLKCIREEKPAIVHLNSSKAGVLGALAARFARVPRIIFTVHGWPFKEKRSTFMSNILYCLSLLTAYLSHSVIVVSKTDLELGQKMPLIGKKIQYIPIGIDTPIFLPKEDALQELWKLVSSEKIPREAMRILIIAELTPNKGIAHALDALLDLRKSDSDNFVCVIMGEGEERNSLETFVKFHRLSDKAFFVGFIPNASTLMHAFDAFLLPSIKEGMPYVLLEAGESGIPIVTTDVVNPEIKERYENVRIVRAGNGFAIADAIRKIRENSSGLAPMGGAPHFPLSTMLQQTLELYAKE